MNKKNNNWEYDTCPRCRACVRFNNGKMVAHERGLGYVPYRMYQKISRISGTPVKELYKNNICKEEKIK